jgi:glucokinase
MTTAVGIDLGGTNIKALALTPGGRLLRGLELPTRSNGESTWKLSVQRAFAEVGTVSRSSTVLVGVAAPGLASKDQTSITFMPGRLPGLEGLVWSDFLHIHGQVPVLNDAHAALLGEIWLGAAKNARNAMMLTIGTGVGGAAVVDGLLLRGHIGRAGHLGHISLDPNGPPDIVGTPGSLEDAIGDSTVQKRTAGRFSSTKSLVAAARRGDSFARKTWITSVRALAAGIASLVNVLDPEVVVIGGGIAKAGAQLFRPLAGFMKEFEWRPGGHRTRIVPAELGERAGAFGAAWQALQTARKLEDRS